MDLSHLSAREIIRLLDLQPHPEGGHFRETFRDPATDGAGRSVGTAIYYLLEAGEVSEWHRVDAAEIWHYYAGAPMVITISPNGHDAAAHHLGPVLTTAAAAGLARVLRAALMRAADQPVAEALSGHGPAAVASPPCPSPSSPSTGGSWIST